MANLNVRRESDASRALKAWSLVSGVSLVALSRRLGVPQSTASGWANGWQVPSADCAAVLESECGIPASGWPQARVAKPVATDAEGWALVVTTDDVVAFAGEDARPVPFCPGIFVTETGRLIRASKRRGIRFVKPWVGRGRRRGRRTYALKIFGCPQVGIPASRLVCLVYNGSPPDDVRTWVLHRDDDPTNDHHSNLRWGTAKENSEDCLRNEGRARGLTNKRAARAIEMSRTGKTVNQIARAFGVDAGTVRRLLEGRTWQHLDADREVHPYRSKQRVVIALGALGFSAPDIAVLVEMTKQTVHEVLSRARRLGQLPRRLAA